EGVDRAGVVARADEAGVAIAAFVALKPGQKKSIIAMKRHCTVYLPHYMVPDTITFLDGLPVTSTDKVDYPLLQSRAAGEGPRIGGDGCGGSWRGSLCSTTCSCPRCGCWGRRGATGSWASWVASRWRCGPGGRRDSARRCGAPGRRSRRTGRSRRPG